MSARRKSRIGSGKRLETHGNLQASFGPITYPTWTPPHGYRSHGSGNTLVDSGHISLANATEYPLSMMNCGREIHVSSAPERTVTIGQSATEILYALGVEDRVVGTSVWFNPVLPKFRDINANIERIADNDPSFEPW